MTSQRILIVEDQRLALELLESAVNRVLPKFYPDFQKGNYDVARFYEDALDKISNNSYGVVLLDHSMPKNDVGNLEDTDFDSYSDCLEDIGYSLIPEIRKSNPSAIIVGTSSKSEGERGHFKKPDYQISKMWGEVDEGLEKILKQMKGGNE